MCGEDFLKDSALTEHLLDAHPFECPKCAKTYNVVDSLRKHCRVRKRYKMCTPLLVS